ncbi:MAG: hypothetical protein M3N46_05830 [Actinomycetota bacterium]|nr:hypothetical protein [Actinomycetota bacterium]
MPRPVRLLTRTAAAPAAVTLLALVILSGCVPTPLPSASGSGSASSTPSASVSATASVAPTPSARPTPVTIGCDTLVSADVMYAFNPNFGLLTSWTPAAGSAAATAKSKSGIACRWSNQTSRDTIDISVAHLDAASIENLKNEAVSQGTLVPTYGDEAYFRVSGGIGTAVVFQGNYWLVATSVDFAEPGDPSDLIDAALTALK